LTGPSTHAGYVDVALHAARRRGQHRAIAPTVGHRPHKAAQGGASRIDRGYVVRELAESIARVWVGSERELGEVSDHLPLVLDLNRSALETVMFTDPGQPLP
jgi:endonuclease/exonuclease/phosphatase family metal-dependent hydrolase